jgi:hypothetical protein
MALLGQDFIKFDYDTFQIRFTITDTTVDLSSGWQAWWGVSSAATDTTVVIEKASAGWSGGNAPSPGDTSQIEMLSSSIIVKLTQSDFGAGNLQPDEVYYHELVLSDSTNASDSVVVASGEFTVNPSLFTNKGYRP